MAKRTAYCMKCRDHRDVKHPKIVTANGRHRLTGECAKCGTKVSQFVKSSAE